MKKKIVGVWLILSLCCLNAYSQLAYIAMQDENKLQIFDLNTNTEASNISIMGELGRPILNDDFTKVYVVHASAAQILILSTNSQSIIDTIAVGLNPTCFEIVPGSPNKAYVVNQGYNNVYEIDLITNTVVDTISVGSYPLAMAFSPDGAIAYVTNCFDFNVFVVDVSTNTIIGTISTPGETPADVRFSPDGTEAYISLQTGTGNVVVVNTSTHSIITTIPVGYQPHDLIFSPDGEYVYVTNSMSNSVSIINTSTHSVVSTINVGTLPQFVSLSLDGLGVYISNNNSASLSYIDIASNTITETISVGNGPAGLVIVPKNVSVSENFNSLNPKIYPSPCTREMPLVVALEKEGDYSVTLYDVSGNRVLEKRVEDGSGLCQLNVSNLKEGLYLMEVICGNDIYTEKIVLGF